MNLFDQSNKISSKIIHPLNSVCVNYLSYFGTFGMKKRNDSLIQYYLVPSNEPDAAPISLLKFTDAWWDTHLLAYTEDGVKRFSGSANRFSISRTKDKKLVEEIERVFPEMIIELV
jgi:hypothetical protein